MPFIPVNCISRHAFKRLVSSAGGSLSRSDDLLRGQSGMGLWSSVSDSLVSLSQTSFWGMKDLRTNMGWQFVLSTFQRSGLGRRGDTGEAFLLPFCPAFGRLTFRGLRLSCPLPPWCFCWHRQPRAPPASWWGPRGRRCIYSWPSFWLSWGSFSDMMPGGTEICWVGFGGEGCKGKFLRLLAPWELVVEAG